MKKFLLFLLFLAIGGALFFWIVKSIGFEQIGLAFRAFSVKLGVTILVLTIISALVRAFRWRLVIKSQGYNVSTREIIEYYLSGLTISFFAPMVILGGEIFRGYDLKERYSMPWTKSIASVVIDRILEITVYAAVILFGVLYFLFKIGASSISFIATTLSFAILIVLLVIFFYSKSFKKESIISFFLKAFRLHDSNGGETAIEIEKEIFHYFSPQKRVMWQGFGLGLLSVVILLLRTFLLVIFLGKNIGILSAISILAFSFIAIIIPIPAAIGSHEAVQAFVFTALGLGANNSIVYTFTIRGAEVIVALIGALFLIKTGWQLLNIIIVKKLSKFKKKKN